MMFPKKPRIDDKEHLAFIRTLPCVKCSALPCEAAHIRSGTDGGTGLKPSDCWVVPLCAVHHYEQHQKGELTFWGNLDKARQLAKHLYLLSGFSHDGKKFHDHSSAANAIVRARCNFSF